MRQILVGVFERHADALRAVQVLREGGIAEGSVHVTDQRAASVRGSADADDTVAAHIRSFFAEIFGPQTHPPAHVERHAALLHTGGALVRVDLGDEGGVEPARRALHACGAIRVEEHEADSSAPGDPAPPHCF